MVHPNNYPLTIKLKPLFTAQNCYLLLKTLSFSWHGMGMECKGMKQSEKE